MQPLLNEHLPSTKQSPKAAFLEFYNTQLHATLALLEEDRLALLKKVKLMWWVVITLALLVVLVNIQNLNIQIVIAAVFACITVGEVLQQYLSREFRLSFKMAILEPLIQFINPSLTYQPTQGVSEYLLRDAGWFGDPDKYNISKSDLVQGNFEGFPCQFSEFRVVTRNKKRSTTVFQGILLALDLPTIVPATTIIQPDMIGFAEELEQFTLPEGAKRIPMDDPGFEKVFTAYSTDAVQANYLLPNNLLAVLTDFHTETGVRLYLTFRGRRLMIGFSQDEKIFEPDLFESLISPTLIYSYVQNFELIKKLLSCLNLNQKVWLQNR